MKLYLSSYYLGNDPSKFAALFTSNKKVAIIMNAADVYDPATRPHYLKKEIASLAEIGLEGEELDLRDYFDNRDKLAVRLGRYGGVWVRGGNSFVLRRAAIFVLVALNIISTQASGTAWSLKFCVSGAIVFSSQKQCTTSVKSWGGLASVYDTD